MHVKTGLGGLLLCALGGIHSACGAPLDEHIIPQSCVSQQKCDQYLAKKLDFLNNSKDCTLHYFSPKYQKNKKNITISAQEFHMYKKRIQFKKNVSVKQFDKLILADEVNVFKNKNTIIDRITFHGNVKIYHGSGSLIADSADLEMHPKSLFLYNLVFHDTHEKQAIYGAAKSGYYTKEKSSFNQATYSTCRPDHPFWKIIARKIKIDGQRFSVERSVLYIKNIPIFYLPYYSFYLDHRKKSGFLPPKISLMNEAGHHGLFFSIPYYVNISPRQGALLEAQYFGARGFRTVLDVRALSQQNALHLRVSAFPHDALSHTLRSGMAVIARTDLDNWKVQLRLNWVSDSDYLRDTGMMDGLHVMHGNELLNQLHIQYQGAHWHFDQIFEGHHHLLCTESTVHPAWTHYKKFPDLQWSAYYGLQHVDYFLDAGYTNFLWNDDAVLLDSKWVHSAIQRIHLKPKMAFHLEHERFSLKPALAYDILSYNSSSATIQKNPLRTIPIYSIDARYRSKSHTLGAHEYSIQPHIFYVYVPYRDQSQLPILDTIESPYFFDQLFLTNRFEGVDRQSDENDLRLGVTTRIHNALHQPVIEWKIGQSIDLAQGPKENSWVNEMSLHLNTHTRFTGAVAWNHSETQYSQLRFDYRMDRFTQFNLSYLRLHTTWPEPKSPSAYWGSYGSVRLHPKWTLMYNAYYNITEAHLESLLSGLTYENCCWSLSAVIKKDYFNMGRHSTSTAYLIGLNFKGLAHIGSNPNTFLRNQIPGFGPS